MTLAGLLEAAPDPVLTEVTQNSLTGWTAGLRIDETNPFFFDHPLDHVPGMLLLESIVRLAARASAERAGGVDGPWTAAAFEVTALELDLVRLCEKDLPADVALTPAPGAADRWHARVEQAGAQICRGEISLVQAPGTAAPRTRTGPGTGPPRAGSRTGATGVVPAPAALVHKRRPVNVVVGPLETTASGFGCAVLPTRPATGRSLSRLCLLVEAARQFATMSGHVVQGTPLDWQFLLRAVHLSVPEPLPRDEPLRLWSEDKPGTTRNRRFTAQVRTATRTLGQITFVGTTLRKEAYLRMRQNSPVPGRNPGTSTPAPVHG